jgi:DHA1 family tetracycline resistance protein-like MFS transporter
VAAGPSVSVASVTPVRPSAGESGGDRRALATVVAVVFIDLLGFGIVIPILPFYVRSFGISDVFIGLLAATYSLAQFGFAPLLGQVSDERGRRPVILVSLLGGAVGWTLFGLAGTLAGPVGLVVLFGSRALAGAAGGNIAAAQGYVADVTVPERRAAALGLLGAAFGLGFVFGPAVGAALAFEPVLAAARDLAPWAPITRFSLPSFAAAGFSLVALGVAAVTLREPDRERETAPRRRLVGQFVAAFRDDTLRGLVLAFFLVSVAFSGVQVMFIPFVADVHGLDETGAALLLTYIGVLGVFVQGGLVGPLSRRFAERTLAAAGAALLAVALVAIPLTAVAPVPSVAGLDSGVVALLATLALLAVGNGVLSVSLTTLVSRGASAQTQGSAFGVTQGAGSLGRTLGPPAMAALYVFSVPGPFVVGALLVVPVVAVLFAGRRLA